MPEKLNMSALYAASLPPRRKQDLLAVYRDYISLVRNLEQVVRRYKPLNLANYQITRLYEGEVVDNPWEVEEITPEARRAYTDFIANKPAEHGAHYCFVSVNYTSAQLRSEEPGIFPRLKTLPCTVPAIPFRRALNAMSPLMRRAKPLKTLDLSFPAAG